MLDEFGGLAIDSPARCEAMIQHHLMDRLGTKPRMYVPDVDRPDTEKAASEYAQLVADGGLDLTLLGLGANGHIGMNEPGSTAGSEARVVELAKETGEHAVEAYGSDHTPTWGITLGMRPILESAEIWLLVTGAHKSETLAAALHSPIGPDIPATYLRNHPTLTILADEEAAAQL